MLFYRFFGFDGKVFKLYENSLNFALNEGMRNNDKIENIIDPADKHEKVTIKKSLS